MNKVLKISAIVAFLMGCASTPSTSLSPSPEERLKQKREELKLNEVIEESGKTPDWVNTQLDSWDCDTGFCAVGRAEIIAEDASPFTCLEASKLYAKANLTSVIKTDISQKVIAGHEDFSMSKQELQTITVNGFEVRNIQKMRITNNYYRKILKYVSGAPQTTYQCFSVASIAKMDLQKLLEREAEQRLTPKSSEKFKEKLEKEFDRFFKISPENEPSAKLQDTKLKHEILKEIALAPSSDKAETVATVAKAFMGLPYQLGGNIKDGAVDCSEFVRLVYKTVGYQLPRTSPEQFNEPAFDKIPPNNLKKGDLVFFSGSLRPEHQVSHVGIYLENGQFINANGNESARKIQMDDLNNEDWQERYLGARRVINTST